MDQNLRRNRERCRPERIELWCGQGDEPVLAESCQLKRGNAVNGQQWCNVEASERPYKSEEQENKTTNKTRRIASKDTQAKNILYNCTK